MIDLVIKIKCDIPYCRTSVLYDIPKEFLNNLSNFHQLNFAISQGWLLTKDNKIACCKDCLNRLNDTHK